MAEEIHGFAVGSAGEEEEVVGVEEERRADVIDLGPRAGTSPPNFVPTPTSRDIPAKLRYFPNRGNLPAIFHTPKSQIPNQKSCASRPFHLLHLFTAGILCSLSIILPNTIVDNDP